MERAAAIQIVRSFHAGLSFRVSRERTDASVIFSIAILACTLTIYMNGFELLYDLARANQAWHVDAVSTFFVFLGTATAIFGVRRIVDYRREHRRRQMAENRARFLALHDPLTRLPNRVHFERTLATTLESSRRGAAVLLLDLNGFRGINDLYGIEGGDSTLTQVAARLRDQVGNAGVVARFGDDEFAIC